MILAFDTYYFDRKAKTVCLSFEDWTTHENVTIYTEILDNVDEYISGEFYKRELPCILSLLKKISIETIDLIIVDGFVYLDDENKFGLGAYLHIALDAKIPIIGVAKTNFASIEKNKVALRRGKSERPLFITAVGIDLDKATDLIKHMKGEYRIPNLLKHLDTLTKEV
jgi:deoxyribonuclease V